jgi:hypothetical protein
MQQNKESCDTMKQECRKEVSFRESINLSERKSCNVSLIET